MIKQAVRGLVRSMGYDLTPRPPLADDERAVLDLVRPYTMTSEARLLALIDAVKYLARRRIGGAFVECGVWRGGSSMAAAAALLRAEGPGRDLYLFDTFAGMPPPTDKDKDAAGVSAQKHLDDTPKNTGVWCYATLEDVRQNLARTGYPADKLHFVVGKVEDTIPAPGLGAIALLRLDTDWYESTLHELEHLFPLLADGGVLILDDYGYWQGARQATDEYFARHPDQFDYLHRIDDTGRVMVKRSRP